MNIVAHNILAMNANRQFNITSKDKAKSTEKLSSGYRINRASDDAAGLSISEKMRRQIRGLSQGVENTQDGVSLCQVADGALAEVSDMLHRITELSIKSANGTNSPSDRQAIQDEIGEILQEIDRIGETTKFNEQKIFKSTNNDNMRNEAISAGDIKLACSGTPVDSSITQYTFDADDSGISINGQKIAWKDIKASNGDTIDSLNPNTYAATYNGLSFKIKIEDGNKIEDVIHSIKGTQVDVKVEGGKAVEAVREVYDGFVDAYDSGTKQLSLSKDEYFALAKSNHTLTADANGVTWNGQTIKWSDQDPSAASGISYEESIQNGTYSLHFEFEKGPKFQIALNSNATLSGVIAALNGATFDIINTGNVAYAFDSTIPLDSVYEVDADFWGIKNDTWEKLGYNSQEVYNVALNQSLNIDSTDLRKTKLAFSDGSSSVEFELTQESKDELADIIDNHGGMVPANEKLSLKFQNGNSERTFSIKPLQEKSLVETLNYLDTIIKDRLGFPSSWTELSVTNFKINDISQGNIGNAPVSYDFEIMQPNLAATSNGGENSHSLWIQSGCDAGDGICLEIDPMNTSILGIDDLNLSTIDGAYHAMDAVNTALEKLSANRSKIGAQQNRLEHTIDNENNIVENTTAAESRIRDTDMAEEMVSFSKSNIIEQAGQVMLAQANQSNQGILSLLQ